jgi:Flp pilus assembly protein protease CpaA
MSYIAIFSLFILVIIAAITDYKKTIIPNKLILVGFIVALILQSLGMLKDDWLTLFIDFIIFFLPMAILWVIGTLTSFQAFAAGDVKLIAIMAMFIDPSILVIIFISAMVLVSLVNITKLEFSFYKEFPKEIYYFIFFGIPGKPKERLQNVPFGPFLAITTIVTISYFYIII